MSLFNFGAAEDTSVGNFDFADDDQVDPGIRKMFEDPDFSFSQDFPEAPSDPFTNSFPVGQPASDIVADNFPVSGSAPVAAAAPTPPRPAADYAPRRPAPSPHTARPGHSPHSGRPAQDVSHQQHHAADRSHQTAQRKVAAPAQRAADPDRRKLAGSGSREPAARLTVTSDPPARSGKLLLKFRFHHNLPFEKQRTRRRRKAQPGHRLPGHWADRRSGSQQTNCCRTCSSSEWIGNEPSPS